ncbi:MAG TPA: hypothetical protein PLF01_01695 [Alphaproteobacteria bacterium]|nr:hypothetical protein [Alphaproteobacteria bacterium]
MNKFSLLSISCAAIFLSGCDHYSAKLASLDEPVQEVYEIAPASGGEMSFGKYLETQYYQMARYEQDKMYDYKAAKYYTEKAQALSQGKMVAPASPEEFDISASKMPALQEARMDLEDALHLFNIPENRYAMAMAQSRYDCWVDEAEENKEMPKCRAEFEQAMRSLVIPEYFYEEDIFEDDIFDLDV